MLEIITIKSHDNGDDTIYITRYAMFETIIGTGNTKHEAILDLQQEFMENAEVYFKNEERRKEFDLLRIQRIRQEIKNNDE